MTRSTPVHILLVEDNPADARLTRIALADAKIRNTVSVAEDGVDALEFLRQEGKHAGASRTDLVLLDLNLPKKDGREVLADIKGDDRLRQIPVVILTTSQADEDIVRSYKLNANAYVTKPVDFERFMRVIESIEQFWLEIVRLP